MPEPAAGWACGAATGAATGAAAGGSAGVSWDQAGEKARNSEEASKVRVKTGTARSWVILILSSMVVVVRTPDHTGWVPARRAPV
jgi:hypothetical protein